jgi:protein TonB
MINDEVQRRLAEERTRLEQQRAQELAAAQTKAPAQAPAETVAATPQQPEPVPAPLQQPAPAPPSVAVPPPPTPAQPAQAQTAREGDLVPIGTPGLTTPKLDKLFKVPYPNQARMARVEGTVTVQVLVSETGSALDVKVLRGVPQLNEAATEMARRSTFRPATKDGVRVRSYYNMTIPFKL